MRFAYGSVRPMLDVIANRRSPRAIDPDRDVDPSLVDAIFDAARWAPSSGNRQPWSYIVFDSSTPDALGTARSWLDQGNAWALRAPVLVLVVARAEDDKGKNAFHQYDTGAATVLAALQAHSEGLVFHQMAGYDQARAANDTALPDTHRPMSIIAIGHPGREDLLVEKDAKREHTERRRKPLESVMKRGAWQ